MFEPFFEVFPGRLKIMSGEEQMRAALEVESCFFESVGGVIGQPCLELVKDHAVECVSLGVVEFLLDFVDELMDHPNGFFFLCGDREVVMSFPLTEAIHDSAYALWFDGLSK